MCAVLCTASCLTCALWSTEPWLRKARVNNLNIKHELHSIAAAFGWLIVFPYITCMFCTPVQGLSYTRLPWEYGCVWLQENVSDDMVGLSSQLLANVRAMQGAVQTREGLLSEAETAQDASLVNADYAVKTSKNIKNRWVRVL